MKGLVRAILLIGAFFVLGIVPALHAADTYAAIAFHQPSRTWAYSTEAATKEEAIAAALRKCGHSDAKTNWSRNSWLAFQALPDGDHLGQWRRRTPAKS